jgi:hypothetical protein
MEYCNLGQLMVYNDNLDGYEYNKNLIVFLINKLFLYENNNNNNLDFILKDKFNKILDDISLKINGKIPKGKY